MEWLENLLNNSAVLAVLYTIVLTIFSRMIIRIFNWGKMSRAELVTKEEFKVFESNMRSDMREYRKEIQESVMQFCIRELDKELKDLKNSKQIAEDLRVKEQLLDEKMKSINEKLDKINILEDNLRTVDNKLKRIESTDSTSSLFADLRRKDN